jgi:hypothetical protein
MLTTLPLIPKPYVQRCCVTVNVPHQSYLMTSFFIIILVDTNGIDPKPSLLVQITNMTECFPEIFSDREGLPVKEDRMFAVSWVRLSPLVGKRFEFH